MSDSLKNYRPRRVGKRIVTACWWVLCALFRLESVRVVFWAWREGFDFETIDNSLGSLLSEGLIEPVRDKDGAIVQRDGRITWVITEEGAERVPSPTGPRDEGATA